MVRERPEKLSNQSFITSHYAVILAILLVSLSVFFLISEDNPTGKIAHVPSGADGDRGFAEPIPIVISDEEDPSSEDILYHAAYYDATDKVIQYFNNLGRKETFCSPFNCEQPLSIDDDPSKRFESHLAFKERLPPSGSGVNYVHIDALPTIEPVYQTTAAIRDIEVIVYRQQPYIIFLTSSGSIPSSYQTSVILAKPASPGMGNCQLFSPTRQNPQWECIVLDQVTSTAGTYGLDPMTAIQEAGKFRIIFSVTNLGISASSSDVYHIEVDTQGRVQRKEIVLSGSTLEPSRFKMHVLPSGATEIAYSLNDGTIHLCTDSTGIYGPWQCTTSLTRTSNTPFDLEQTFYYSDTLGNLYTAPRFPGICTPVTCPLLYVGGAFPLGEVVADNGPTPNGKTLVLFQQGSRTFLPPSGTTNIVSLLQVNPGRGNCALTNNFQCKIELSLQKSVSHLTMAKVGN